MDLKDKDIKQAEKTRKQMVQQGPPGQPGQPGQPKKPAVKQPAGRPSGTDGIPQQKERESKSFFSFNKNKGQHDSFSGSRKKGGSPFKEIT